MPKRTIQWGAIGTILSIVMVAAAALGGYYAVKARGEQAERDLQGLRESQMALDRATAARWSKLDDVLAELLARGIRNETKIEAILTTLRDHIRDSSEAMVPPARSASSRTASLSPNGVTQ